jgi:Leucine-rich repeat (LRR) protein
MSSNTFHDMDRIHDVDSQLEEVGLEDHGETLGEVPKAFNEPACLQHDQLPNVDEYKTSQQVGGSSRQCRKIILVAALGIIVATVLITVGVVVGRDTAPAYPQDVSQPDTGTTSEDATQRFVDIATLISNMGWASASILRQTGSPQMQAVEWLATDDPLHLDVDATEEFMNRYLLATIYYALGGWNWSYDLNWLSANSTCDWKTIFETQEGISIEIGVSCHDGDSVKEIFLPNMNMEGTLPDEIGLFFDLENLNLFGNNLSGELPNTMKHLKYLRTLVLHNNAFKASLPPWITTFTNLQTLNLAENSFSGELPTGMGSSMTSLETLILESNNFYGYLDPLMNATNLHALYLGENDFEGAFKNEVLSSWQEIQIIDISENALTGSLPTFLFAKEDLLVVDLHSNQFKGKLPSIVEQDGSIEFLALQDNELTGEIGVSILGLTRLRHLDLSKNFFSGDMPTSLGKMKSLKYLFLAFNTLFNEGPIPVQYATLPNLVDLSLQKTNRKGTIPYQFEALSKLVLMDFNSNKLSGSIPHQIGGMASLTFLLLKDNYLNGTIPATLQELANMDTLLLDHNHITGGLESVCKPVLPALTTFVADCPKSGTCACCTSKCCTLQDTSCNDVVWYSDVDPIASNGYVRDSYFFYEQDIIFPVPKDVVPNYYKNYSGYYSKAPP